ncbi:MAG TPA: hypothetical protein ENI19_02015 [Candidatus Nealsonbacteria bacterium]|uniref:homoserine dehydrogenase n=1 Tax=marine sediment metagenome TaxID=412755 RepID=A0A0F9WZE2_9ZZZZ|nr:hypothetical protein [Candidatus Nealsonbacteria bacterium]HEB46466.1 hypothetical protein [Candidatus Nealsonbacteria bacterium]
MKVGIIGFGRIGSELSERILKRDWEIPAIARTSGIYKSPGGIKIGQLNNWMEHFQKVDVVCLCITTLDNGEAAYGYIRPLVERGISVVTCEKGALGNYFPELQPWMGNIGYSATVGGGTRLLRWLKERLGPNTKEIHLIVNGTLNYIFDGLSRGRTLDEVVDEAKTLGYAEPEAEEPVELINTEANKDVPSKVSVLLNVCGFGEIRARDIDVKTISESDLKRLVREATFRRYIVSITKEANEEDVIGGFKLSVNDWHISAGFKNRSQNPLFLQLVPPGVNNVVLIYGSDGTYILTGPGAGAVPTVGSMMKDIGNLLNQ